MGYAVANTLDQKYLDMCDGRGDSATRLLDFIAHGIAGTFITMDFERLRRKGFGAYT